MASVKLTNIKPASISSIKAISPNVKIRSKLPFRVKFSNITIENYGPLNPGGIGVKIIGYNNYVL